MISLTIDRRGATTIDTNQNHARPNFLKQLNKRKILDYIQNHNGESRANISKALQISKPTTSSLVDELISENWISERESLSSSSVGGRKPYKLFFNKNNKYIIGIDIGGTNVELAIINLAGEFIHHQLLSTKSLLENDFITTLGEEIKKLIQMNQIEEKVMAIGVGVPGITDVEKGIVFEAPSLGWEDYPFKKLLEEQLPYPVYLDNDVNIAVLGEQWKGAAIDKENVVLVTLGTGVGCGIIINGQLYRGATYAAGEIGYMVTDYKAAQQVYDPIYSGYGFLDSHVGGPSITTKMIDRLQELCPDTSIDKDALSAKKVFEKAMEGDTIALEVVEESISHLAFSIVNVISLINPECVVIGGGIAKSGHWFLPKVKEIIESHLPMQTEVYITKIDNVALLGAASLCLREHNYLQD